MQTILNYGNLANSAATAPYIQSMLSQYSNFPGTSHQQYMDVLNMYSKYAQSSLGFPDLNSLGAAGAFAGGGGAQKSPMPGSATSPLSALGDLTGFYGMGGLGKSYGAPNTGAGPTNPTPGMLFPSQFNGKSTTSYPTAYPHSGMYNFGSDFAPSSSASANLMNLGYPSSSANNMHLSNSPAPPPPPPTAAPPNTISLTTSGLFPTPMTTTATSNKSKNSSAATITTTANSNIAKNNAPPLTTSRIDLTKMPMEYSRTNPPPLVDLTKPTSQTSPTIAKRNILQKKNDTSQSKATTTSTISSSSATSSKLPASSTANVLRKQSALSSVGTNSKNLTSKLSNEMLIIPTTSPPGPTSISKQFSDISPSISLTALNNTPTLTPINTNSKNLNKTQLPSPTFLPLSNGKSTTAAATKPTIPTTAKTLTNQAIPPLNKNQPKIQVAKFATLSRQTNNTSPANNNSNNVRKLAGTPTKLLKTSRTVTPAAAAAITTTTNKNNSSNQTITSTVNSRAVYPPLANLSFSNQKKPNVTTTTLTPAQIQKLRAFGVSASAGSAASKVGSNEISIRPMDSSKAKSATGDNVYIIETNINDKRVAIGAPTRSGNGTTVTKVSAPLKRKNVDVLQMDGKKPR